MLSQHASLPSPLAYDPPRGSGRLVVLLPGAGDVRSENRFLAATLVDAGYRVVSADLPGHGESATAPSYSVEAAAAALIRLIDHLDAGPAIVIGTSFAPAAAVWAATARPDKVTALVAISPHFEADTSLKGRLLKLAMSTLLRGPVAGPIWDKLYRSWYKSGTPDDLEAEIEKLKTMLGDPEQRRAVRQTLLAGREGVAERMAQVTVPSLVVFGGADDHFADPAAEAAAVSARLGAEWVMVDAAGHYPHVERPDVVGPAVTALLDRLAR